MTTVSLLRSLVYGRNCGRGSGMKNLDPRGFHERQETQETFIFLLYNLLSIAAYILKSLKVRKQGNAHIFDKKLRILASTESFF